MMRGSAPDVWVSDYIVCRPKPTPATHRTKRWEVRTSLGGDVVLGGVSWYAPWRRYVFVPCMNTVYDAACLRELADFTDARTADHKAGL